MTTAVSDLTDNLCHNIQKSKMSKVTKITLVYGKMKNWKQATLNPNSTIREALEVIEQAGIQIALVVDKKYQLVGVITDGDIRKAFFLG